jgi:hypothetical protein
MGKRLVAGKSGWSGWSGVRIGVGGAGVGIGVGIGLGVGRKEEWLSTRTGGNGMKRRSWS